MTTHERPDKRLTKELYKDVSLLRYIKLIKNGKGDGKSEGLIATGVITLFCDIKCMQSRSGEIFGHDQMPFGVFETV